MPASERFRLRHREQWLSNLGYSGKLLLIVVAMLGVSLGLLWSGVDDAALAAAVSTAIAALVGFSVLVNVPLGLFAEVWIYFSAESDNLLRPAPTFGRTIYRESARLDALAQQAGLPMLAEFESPDPLDTRQPPTWHDPRRALPTVEYLLGMLTDDDPAYQHLLYLGEALRLTAQQGARFYLLVSTWAGGTNARVEAYRRGESM